MPDPVFSRKTKWIAHAPAILVSQLEQWHSAGMSNDEAVLATCHCGAITVRFAHAPAEVVECNCSLCRKLGVLWAYVEASDIEITPAPAPTHTYAWNGRHVDFHRCTTCGCLTYWVPRDSRTRRGVNARLLPPEVLAAARLRHRDGTGTGRYLD